MNINARLEALERRITLERRTTRVIMSLVPGRPASLAGSRCSRTLHVNGFLFELVTLNGNRGSLTDEDLGKFVESFPIEPGGRSGRP
jgi:hypothetical protein